MHQPVLLSEVIQALAVKSNGYYIDGTFGRGGHSQQILQQLTDGKLLVIDKDPVAIKAAKEKFADDSRVIICHGSFANMAEFVDQAGWAGKVSGILLDLGVSSPQLDQAERGFSFLREGALDMRMDTSKGLSAADWLREVAEQELADVLYEFGEERYSRRIARAIVMARAESPITSTKVLAEIIAKAHPKWEKHKHPATRCFQAIRIYINNELGDLEQGLEQGVNVLQSGGRLAVISFHSLEDRIVKRFIQRHARGIELPRGLPINDRDMKEQCLLREVGKAIKPSLTEVDANPRARSAVLRVAEKK